MLKKLFAFALSVILLANCRNAVPTSTPETSLSQQLNVQTSGLITDSHFLLDQINPSYKGYFAYGKAQITSENYTKLVESIDAKWGKSCRISQSILKVSSFIFIESVDMKTPVWWSPSITNTTLTAGWQTNDGTIQLRYEESLQSLYLFFDGGWGTKCMP